MQDWRRETVREKHETISENVFDTHIFMMKYVSVSYFLYSDNGESTLYNCFFFSFPYSFCYLGSCYLTYEIAFHTLNAARKYMLPKLEDICRQTIYGDLFSDNVFEIYSYSVAVGDEVLHEYCYDYFTEAPDEVLCAFKSSCFLEITYETLLDMLQKNNTNIDKPWEDTNLGILISDNELFVACHAWAVEECKRQELEPSGPNKRRVLGDCLSLIRFPCMPTSDITEYVLPTGILNEEEKESLLATPSNVAQQMFPSTKQCFFVYIKEEVIECLNGIVNEITITRSTSGKRRRLSSAAYFRVERRSVLSQIWLMPREYEISAGGRQRAKYEVVIKCKNKIKTRQSVVSQVITEGEDPVMLLLDIESFVFKENCEYTLQVHDKGWHSDDSRWEWPEAYFENVYCKMKGLEDFNLSDEQMNQWISGFTIGRL